jgi:hypothetical protein
MISPGEFLYSFLSADPALCCQPLRFTLAIIFQFVASQVLPQR